MSVEPKFKDGRACIRGTPVSVCEIIGDTMSLRVPKDFKEEILYGGIIPREAVDAAYAFLIKNHDKVVKDFEEMYGGGFPQDLYL